MHCCFISLSHPQSCLISFYNNQIYKGHNHSNEGHPLETLTPREVKTLSRPSFIRSRRPEGPVKRGRRRKRKRKRKRKRTIEDALAHLERALLGRKRYGPEAAQAAITIQSIIRRRLATVAVQHLRAETRAETERQYLRASVQNNPVDGCITFLDDGTVDIDYHPLGTHAAIKIQSIARRRSAISAVEHLRAESRAETERKYLRTALQHNPLEGVVVFVDDGTVDVVYDPKAVRAATMLQRLSQRYVACKADRQRYKTQRAKLLNQRWWQLVGVCLLRVQETHDLAATIIQSLIRRRIALHKVKRIRGRQLSEKLARRWLSSVGQYLLCESDKEIKAATKVQTVARRRQARQRVRGIRARKKEACRLLAGLWWAEVGDYIFCAEETEVLAATKVQAMARRKMARRRTQQMREQKREDCKLLAGMWWTDVGQYLLCHSDKEIKAATKVQTIARRRQARQRVRDIRARKKEACRLLAG